MSFPLATGGVQVGGKENNMRLRITPKDDRFIKRLIGRLKSPPVNKKTLCPIVIDGMEFTNWGKGQAGNCFPAMVEWRVADLSATLFINFGEQIEEYEFEPPERWLETLTRWHMAELSWFCQICQGWFPYGGPCDCDCDCESKLQ